MPNASSPGQPSERVDASHLLDLITQRPADDSSYVNGMDLVVDGGTTVI